MSKSAADYLASDRTANQEAFLAWVLTETGVTFKSANERKAFDLGVRASGLYSKYQASKRPAAETTTEAKAAPASVKRPAAKRAATKTAA